MSTPSNELNKRRVKGVDISRLILPCIEYPNIIVLDGVRGVQVKERLELVTREGICETWYDWRIFLFLLTIS